MYMSPEMVRHEMYDSRSDVYSWGVMLAETLRQKMPYDGVYLTPVQVSICRARTLRLGLSCRWCESTCFEQVNRLVQPCLHLALLSSDTRASCVPW